MFTRIRALSAGVLPLVILTALPAAASDAVMDWNQLALAATMAAGQGAVPQTRSMAIVQVAMIAGALFELALAPFIGPIWLHILLAIAGGTFLYLGFHAVHGEWKRRRAFQH